MKAAQDRRKSHHSWCHLICLFVQPQLTLIARQALQKTEVIRRRVMCCTCVRPPTQLLLPGRNQTLPIHTPVLHHCQWS